MNSTNGIVKCVCSNSTSESRALSPHGRNLLHTSSHYGFTFRTFKRLDGMSSIIHSVQGRSNRVVDVDSNLGLLCELISLRDNLSVFKPSHAAFSKDVDRLFYVLNEYSEHRPTLYSFILQPYIHTFFLSCFALIYFVMCICIVKMINKY